MGFPERLTTVLDNDERTAHNGPVADEKPNPPIVSFRVTPEFKTELEAAARAEQISESAFIRRTLAARINEMRAKGELR